MGKSSSFEREKILKIMDTKKEFWSKRWLDGQIGWHRSDFNKHLVKYTTENWKDEQSKRTVFVPLCGKTKDLVWLKQQGCDVVGLEFASQAVEEFFSDNQIEYKIQKFDSHEIYTADGYKIYRGDFFTVPISEKFDLIYDRASLVAIEPDLKQNYAERMKKLLNGEMLLVSLVREEGRTGPPHTVSSNDVHSLYENVTMLSEEDDLSSVERMGKLVESVSLIK